MSATQESTTEAKITPTYQLGRGDRIPFGDPRHFELAQFLDDEATLLNTNDLLAWLDLLEDDIVYRAPVRQTPPRGGGSGFSEGMFFFDEDRKTLEMKASRLATNESAWSEVPASRSRRFISGVRAYTTGQSDEFVVMSSLLLVRSRYSMPEVEVVSCEREDLLRRSGDGFGLANRYIYLDHATIPMQNFALFF